MNINSDNHRQFTFFILILVAISAGFTYGLSSILQTRGITVPFYIEMPSVTGVYAFLFLLFDRYLWKHRYFHPTFKKLGIILSDDLNGKWKGVVKSSYDDFKSDIAAELNIVQTATQITIRGKFNESKSVSVHENFSRNELDNNVSLFYFFRNHPNYDAVESMAMHEGSAILTYDKEADILAGHYYSGRNRHNHGTIEVERVKK